MKLIDADGLKERLKEYCIDGDKEIKEFYEIMGIDDCIDSAPTVDAVDRELYEQCKFDKDIAEEQLKKIVRCKDCKFFVKAKDWFACQKWYMDIRKDDYCSYGERKNDD